MKYFCVKKWKYILKRGDVFVHLVHYNLSGKNITLCMMCFLILYHEHIRVKMGAFHIPTNFQTAQQKFWLISQNREQTNELTISQTPEVFAKNIDFVYQYALILVGEGCS